MRIIDLAVQRFRAIFLLLCVLIILGINSYINIPKEDTPNVIIPVISVHVPYFGVSPADAEKMLVKPLEQHLKSIDGIKKMSSSAHDGGGFVILEFDAGFKSQKALQDVREKVSAAKIEFPEEASDPTIKEINLSEFPVLNIILSANIPEKTLYSVVAELKDQISQLKEVLNVEIYGKRKEQIDIIIDPLLISSHKLSAQDVMQKISSANSLISAGGIESKDGRFSITVPGLLENSLEIFDLPIKTDGQTVIKLRDLAQINDGFAEPTNFTRFEKKQALVLAVSKRSGENIISTIEKVKAIVQQQSQSWPFKEQIKITFSHDESESIKETLNDLENNILFAVILALIPILLTMGLRSSIFVTLSVPVSFLMGIFFLNLMGHSLNIVVIFSLILSIGMLVDASIVVCEYADRKMTESISHKQAYILAAKRMFVPIMSSTATSLIVFVPFFFWPDVIGQFMKYMPITVIATVLSSLIVAFIFIPSIGSVIGLNEKIDQKAAASLLASEENGDLNLLSGFNKKYHKILSKCLDHSGKFVASICIFLVLVIILYIKSGNGIEFFPNIEPTNGEVLIKARGNLSIYEKDGIVKQAEEIIHEFSPEMKSILVKTLISTQNPELIGKIDIEFANWRHRRKATVILNEINEKLTKAMIGVEFEVLSEKKGPSSGKAITMEISSRNFKDLNIASKIIKEKLKQIPGAMNVSDNTDPPQIEWEIKIDRILAAKSGIDMLMVGNFVKLITNGIKITSYRPEISDEEIDIRLRFPENKRNLSQLDNLYIVNQKGISIPIKNFVKKVAKIRTGTIRRTDGLRTITIEADAAEGHLPDSIVEEMKEWLKVPANANLPETISVKFAGEDESQIRTQTFLRNAFLLALISMFFIMLLQFNNVFLAFVIISAVFLSTAGVLLGLLVTAQPFGIVMCGIGIIALAGTVVNNNIIFIDTYNIMLNNKNVSKISDQALKDILIRTGLQRMRPILLTAGTGVLGLIPMVFAINIDFIEREITFNSPTGQWWRQLSTAIAGGLTFATILTLLFTPALIFFAHKLTKNIKNKFAR